MDISDEISMHMDMPSDDTELIDSLAAGGTDVQTSDGFIVRLGMMGFLCKVGRRTCMHGTYTPCRGTHNLQAAWLKAGGCFEYAQLPGLIM
jgi:hypothetical protein